MTTIAYSASKGAIVNFTRALAAEWGKYGITVNALAPGFFPSKMSKGLLNKWGVEIVASHAPLKRLGDDADLKGAALLFASAAGKHITGQILAGRRWGQLRRGRVKRYCKCPSTQRKALEFCSTALDPH